METPQRGKFRNWNLRAQGVRRPAHFGRPNGKEASRSEVIAQEAEVNTKAGETKAREVTKWQTIGTRSGPHAESRRRAFRALSCRLSFRRLMPIRANPASTIKLRN